MSWKISKVFLSDMSLSSSSLLSSKNGAVALLHSSPLHPSQAATHFKPLFRQEHRLVPQTLRDDNLHLHRIITKRLSGAASLSVITGNNILLIFLHLQYSGFSTHPWRLAEYGGKNYLGQTCWSYHHYHARIQWCTSWTIPSRYRKLTVFTI